MSAISTNLRGLRSTRAAPPGRARDDSERRAIYTAALEQFEQLMRAAEVVGPSARPLPLFYALSQAGRAIVAAFGDQPRIDGHGLKEGRTNPPPTDLLHRVIKPDPKKHERDAFGAVCRAINSPTLTTGIELGAVWAALPGTYRIPSDSWRPEWRGALDVIEDIRHPATGKTHVQVLSFAGNPHHDVLTTLTGRYPTLPADTTVGVKGGDLGPGSWIAVLTWSDEHDLDVIAPESEADTSNGRVLLPTLPNQDARPKPLMLWWVLLFGLSVHARYHPELWIKALAVDESAHAVPLEGLLDGALAAVPALLYQTLA